MISCSQVSRQMKIVFASIVYPFPFSGIRAILRNFFYLGHEHMAISKHHSTSEAAFVVLHDSLHGGIHTEELDGTRVSTEHFDTWCGAKDYVHALRSRFGTPPSTRPCWDLLQDGLWQVKVALLNHRLLACTHTPVKFKFWVLHSSSSLWRWYLIYHLTIYLYSQSRV